MRENDREMGKTDETRYVSLFLTPIHEGPVFSYFINLWRSVPHSHPVPLGLVAFQWWTYASPLRSGGHFTQGLQKFLITSHHTHLLHALAFSRFLLFGSRSTIWDYYLGVEFLLIFCFWFFLIQFCAFASGQIVLLESPLAYSFNQNLPR